MTDYIIIGIIVVIVGAAIGYIVKAKKSGKKCIGCPDCSACAKKGGNSSCCCNQENK